MDRNKFAIFRNSSRLWAVGAIHGEFERLVNLHEKLGDRILEGDRLVYLGNFLGYGESIIRTIDELLLFRRQIIAAPPMHACDIVFLRGQQEEMWQKTLQLHLSVGPSEVLVWMLDQGLRATLAAYGADEETALRRARSGALELARWTNELRRHMQNHEGHIELMSSLRRAALTEEETLLFVHSGIDPDRPLDAQGDAFWWNFKGFTSISEQFAGFKKVVRGFDPTGGGVSVGSWTATTDGGCGRGGLLTAMCFNQRGDEVDRIEA